MTTQAQISANRQNASKSTGPRTAEGKAAISLKMTLWVWYNPGGSGDFDLFSHVYAPDFPDLVDDMLIKGKLVVVGEEYDQPKFLLISYQRF